MLDNSEQSRQDLMRLARQSSMTTKTLITTQQAISRAPYLETNDSIHFQDCLNREFRLPFSFFDNWQTFENFLKSKFDQSVTPGGHHVKTGSFMVTKAGNERQILTKSSWASMVYPGCNLSMTIIFHMLRLSLSRCPRQDCGSVPSRSVEEGGFVECSRCGLTYRFDPDTELPSTAIEGQRIAQQQHSEDVQLPSNEVEPESGLEQDYDHPVGWYSKNERVDVWKTEDDGNILAPLPTEHEAVAPAASAIDWNAGLTGLEAWLAQSAMPMTEPPLSEQDELQQDIQQRQRELRDLQSLQKIHFVALAPDTKPLTLAIPQYRKMPLEAQIYLRKIADKFPALPMNLTERFAKSSVARKNRLKGLRTLEESLVKGPEIVPHDDDQLDNAKPTDTRRSRRYVFNEQAAAERLSTVNQEEDNTVYWYDDAPLRKKLSSLNFEHY
ncbi:hypothetical protein LTR70_006535 [Exophiala xenobiotica]|uniref:Ubiquitin-like domain-containing protein n=1 Tax=Lithohypha guttulata TaxID=1690604 RepID=A0ABR0K7N1_9EURO|nr:hypothetical protein LTR24_006024 [Lithohypha guttulata]KAK5315893.1 hypothetical protein LTR70_006535 [Exophiala xenobiotica]